MLTRKQRELLVYIHHCLQERGVAPSYEEMAVHCGLRSKSGIYQRIKALETRGFIRRRPYCARAIDIIRLPADYLAADYRPGSPSALEISPYSYPPIHPPHIADHPPINPVRQRPEREHLRPQNLGIVR